MKKPFLLAAIVASGLLLSSTSCKDGGTAGVWGVSGEIPKQVTELKTESDYGRIILSWKIPDDEAFYYAKVKYADPLNGAPVVKDVSIYAADEAGYCEMIVDGLVDTEEQNFSVTSCSYGHKFSEPVSVTGSALEPPIYLVKRAIDVVPDVWGALVSWQNTTGIPVVVAVTHNVRPEAGGGQRTLKFTSAADGSVRVPNVDKASPGLSIEIFDASETASSGAVSFSDIELVEDEATLKGGIQANVLGWTVVSEGTPLGDGLGGTALLDGRTEGGVLHTGVGAQLFPFSVVYDMQKPTVLTKLGLFRRNDDTTNPPSLMRVELSADNVTWTPPADLTFANIAEWQYIYPEQDIPVARYMRLTIVRAANGAHAGLGEINVTGVIRE